MSANQEAMRTTIAAAAVTKASALQTAASTAQGTIAASSTSVGYWCGKGGAGEAAYQAAVIAANNQLVADRLAAERAKQNSEYAARDNLRTLGEIGY